MGRGSSTKVRVFLLVAKLELRLPAEVDDGSRSRVEDEGAEDLREER